MRRLQRCVFTWFCLLLPGAALAAPPQADADLLKLVGADAGLVVEVTGLSKQLPKLKQNGVVGRLEQTALYRQWKEGDDFRKLAASRTVIEQLLGKPLEEFIDEVFGRSVVLAVYPTGADETQTVFMTEAVNSAALESALEAWNRADRSELTRMQLAGHEYVRRTKAGSGDKPATSQFYARFDRILALSDNEAAIRRVVALHAAGVKSPPNRDDPEQQPAGHFLSSAANRAARRALPQQRFVSVYLNPRAWDGRLKSDAGKQDDAQFLSDAWQRCDSIAAGLYADDRGLVVEAVAHYGGDVAEDISSHRKADDDLERLPAFLTRTPREAVAVFAGEHDLARAAGFLLGRAHSSHRAEQQRTDVNRLRQIARGVLVGFDLFDDVLPALGGNWGAYVVAASGEAAARSPLEGVAGVELPPPGRVTRGKITLRDGLDNALETALRLAASFTRSEAKIDVRSQEEEGSRLRWVEIDAAVRPAYALGDDYLVAGTSPGVLKEFMRLDAGESIAADAAFRKTAQRYFSGHNQLLYVNAAALRKVIATHHPLLAERLAGTKGVSRAESERRVELLQDLLQAFDAAYLAGRADGRRIRLTAGLSVAPPAAAADR